MDYYWISALFLLICFVNNRTCRQSRIPAILTRFATSHATVSTPWRQVSVKFILALTIGSPKARWSNCYKA